MESRIERNRRYLTDFFGGPFPGHALIVNGPLPWHLTPGDYAVHTDRPVDDWLDFYEASHEAKLARLDEFDDDSVPFVNLCGTTGFFANAFGCPFHVYENGSIPCARPIVRHADEADALAQPTLDDGPIPRYFELVDKLIDRLGPDVPISVPDIQSPFGIAAIIWNKEDFLVAMIERPDAVKRLVAKCHTLLTGFLQAMLDRMPHVVFAHCPTTWAPPELGCWLSEDEIGSFSAEMFEEFCLPSLTDLSRTFNGLFMHCCARADHQYASWGKIPDLRAINPKIFEPGPGPLIDMYPGKVFMYGCLTDEQIEQILAAVHPETRLLLQLGGKPETVRPQYDRLRERCARRTAGAR
jgi:hypothetical protein